MIDAGALAPWGGPAVAVFFSAWRRGGFSEGNHNSCQLLWGNDQSVGAKLQTAAHGGRTWTLRLKQERFRLEMRRPMDRWTGVQVPRKAVQKTLMGQSPEQPGLSWELVDCTGDLLTSLPTHSLLWSCTGNSQEESSHPYKHPWQWAKTHSQILYPTMLRRALVKFYHDLGQQQNSQWFWQTQDTPHCIWSLNMEKKYWSFAIGFWEVMSHQNNKCVQSCTDQGAWASWNLYSALSKVSKIRGSESRHEG